MRSQRQTWNLFYASLALFVVAQSGALAASLESYDATVISITDGDTVIVSHDGVPENIRLLDVDCPEKGQPYGQAAKRCLKDMLYLHNVRINAKGKDRYGRTLASVVRDDGTNVNEELLRSGYAWVYRGRSKNAQLKEFERQAKLSRRGLWNDPEPIAPWQYRSSQKELSSRRNPANVSDPSGLIRQLLHERNPVSSTKRSGRP